SETRAECYNLCLNLFGMALSGSGMSRDTSKLSRMLEADGVERALRNKISSGWNKLKQGTREFWNDNGGYYNIGWWRKGGSNTNEIKEVYNSIKESPNYPKDFKAVQNGTTKNPVKNKDLIEKLREIEPGNWNKIYKDGYDSMGNEISIHYFQSQSGKVFNVKVKIGWSN
ncbi:MAG: hypothetical protein ACI4HQ_14235, partial [Acetatifactor sp.]